MPMHFFRTGHISGFLPVSRREFSRFSSFCPAALDPKCSTGRVDSAPPGVVFPSGLRYNTVESLSSSDVISQKERGRMEPLGYLHNKMDVKVLVLFILSRIRK